MFVFVLAILLGVFAVFLLIRQAIRGLISGVRHMQSKRHAGASSSNIPLSRWLRVVVIALCTLLVLAIVFFGTCDWTDLTDGVLTSTTIDTVTAATATTTPVGSDTSFGKLGNESGHIAYNLEDSMRIDSDYRAVVSIIRGEDIILLTEGLRQLHTTVEKIRVSSRLRVTLVDPSKTNFQVEPLSSEEQQLEDSATTEWRWNIKPLKAGFHTLLLKVSIINGNGTSQKVKDIVVFDKPFYVKSSIAYAAESFWSKYWEWLFTVLIIPLFLWCRRVYLDRRAKKRGQRAPIGFKPGR